MIEISHSSVSILEVETLMMYCTFPVQAPAPSICYMMVSSAFKANTSIQPADSSVAAQPSTGTEFVGLPSIFQPRYTSCISCLLARLAAFHY